MKGLAEISILILLITLPIIWGRRTLRQPIPILVGACCVYWFVLLYVVPRLPE